MWRWLLDGGRMAMKRREILSNIRKAFCDVDIESHSSCKRFIECMFYELDPLNEPLDEDIIIFFTESGLIETAAGYSLDDLAEIQKEFYKWFEDETGESIQDGSAEKIYDFFRDNGFFGGCWSAVKATYASDLECFEFYTDTETDQLNKELAWLGDHPRTKKVPEKVKENIDIAWSEDLRKNIRTRYIVVQHVRMENEMEGIIVDSMRIIGSSGFSPCEITEMENDLKDYPSEASEYIRTTPFDTYVAVKPVLAEDNWDFKFDTYCDEKNELTRMINSLPGADDDD